MFEIILIALLLTALAYLLIDYSIVKKQLHIKNCENNMLKMVMAEEGLIPQKFVKKEGK